MMTQLQALVSRWLPRVPNLLRGAHIACRLQPCLRDIHHEHLLYDGDTLTGLIDYASAGQDSVAVDVARMLGSLIEDDDVRWQVALSAYRDVRAFTMAEEELARGLDRAGVIVAMANWWRWMVERDEVEIQGHVLRRVQELVARVERW
jgi:Ser/Thr protein kinase RdoA (MazF antagonist)